METAGEERVRTVQNLCRLEDAGILLKQASTCDPVTKISTDFPKEVSAILNELTTLSSRDDAERLLETGVSMWNSVINLEALCDSSQKEALVKVRHVAADCIYMSITVLSGVSARFNIDEISLLKFYTACGQKYVSELADMDMAAVCFSKASEFRKSAKAAAAETEGGKRALAKALFDLAIGSAECAWERNDTTNAEDLVADASEYLQELPEECEYLASVQFNFGLFAYRAKEYKRAISWLERCMVTRTLVCNPVMQSSKQARALRLSGFCFLALKDFEQALEKLQQAEALFHDPLGAYLLLKLFVLTRSDRVNTLLMQILNDSSASLDICMGSLALLTEAEMLDDAKKGFHQLWMRFQDFPWEQASVIGPRYFDALCSLSHVEDALVLLDDCCSAISRQDSRLVDCENSMGTNQGAKVPQISRIQEYNKWSNLVLHAAVVFLERRNFKMSAILLERCLLLAENIRIQGQPHTESTDSQRGNQDEANQVKSLENVVLKNEAHVCRLAASCALCALSAEHQKLDKSRQEGKEGNNLLCQALRCAQRAKELEPDDLAARLLIFRAYLLKGDTLRAAAEMELASREVREFDAGALAEAACEARDIGSKESILAVLRCIIQAHALEPVPSSSPISIDGFLGTVLVSAVAMCLEHEIAEVDGDSNSSGLDARTSDLKDPNVVLEIMRTGLKALSNTGVLKAFEGQAKADAALSYLSDVAWNIGCQSRREKHCKCWADSFEICYEYSCLRTATIEIRRTCRFAKLMVRDLQSLFPVLFFI
jgi:tetratricopeptide (TPR) repeat protein